jgi:hypothetical protein
MAALQVDARGIPIGTYSMALMTNEIGIKMPKEMAKQ